MKLDKIQKIVYNNTVRMGYSTEKDDVNSHLAGEVLEHLKSKPIIDKTLITVIGHMDDNEKFVKMYEKYIKDTEPCELIDFIMIAITRLTRLSINWGKMFKLKLRYNKLRSKK